LETIRDPIALANAARRAHAAGKPVIVYKLGRSDAGRRLAISHSGAIAGPDAAADEFFRHHGIVRVNMLETLFEIPPLLAGLWLARRRYVLRSSRAGALIGLAAGMMPALFMQLACMYEPSHIMTFHIVPGLAIAIPAALAGAWLLRTDASVY
jgi:acyl-CoA synthetase (NDP forming)